MRLSLGTTQIGRAVEKRELPNKVYDEVFRVLSDYSFSAW